MFAPVTSGLWADYEAQAGANFWDGPGNPVPVSCGLVGLPNAGKSTLFCAITASHAEIARYPFTTIAPNIGIVRIPDPRLAAIAAITRPQRTVPATLELVDIAGLVRNAHKGEGLGNQFLARIREVDALLHIVRCFRGDVTHVEGGIDPTRDIGIVETELLLADLAAVERARANVMARARAGDRTAREQDAVLARLAAHISAGHPARTLAAEPGREPAYAAARRELLTARPVLYVANLGEDEVGGSPCLDAVARHASAEGAPALGLSAKLELELADLTPEEGAQFLATLGVSEGGLPRLIRACQSLLGLRTFFSVASAEVRAWPVPAGTRAQQAAGRVHTDMERGFIRAEVVAFADLVACGSIAAARERGVLRLEGRDYEVRDGDVVTFRFAA
jgi:ribosome-binding ATPase